MSQLRKAFLNHYYYYSTGVLLHLHLHLQPARAAGVLRVEHSIVGKATLLRSDSYSLLPGSCYLL